MSHRPSIYFEIDFHAVDKYMKRLGELSSEGTHFVKPYEQLLQLIGTEFVQNGSSKKQLSPEQTLLVWRGLLIILSSDKIDDWDWKPVMLSLLKLFADIIKSNSNEHIIEFLTLTIAKDRFKSLVQKLQSFITLSIISGTFDSRSIEHSLRLLDVFNSANEMRQKKHKIDYREFYNDAINKEVHLKDHIVKWLKD